MMKDRVETLLRQARESLEKGNREEALQCVKKALEEDPGEMIITEVILGMETSEDHPDEFDINQNSHKDRPPSFERTEAEDMDPKLEKAFRLSDQALASGDDAKALAYLKKAARLFPDDPAVEEKLTLLKNEIRAANLVKIGLKKLGEGDIPKAVAASRKAFEIMPEAPGLHGLLAMLEERETSPRGSSDEPEETEDPDSARVPDAGAMLWADRIRAAVKDDRFEEAGKMVAEAVRNHPDDPLLDSFHTKLKRLGFVE